MYYGKIAQYLFSKWDSYSTIKKINTKSPNKTIKYKITVIKQYWNKSKIKVPESYLYYVRNCYCLR